MKTFVTRSFTFLAAVLLFVVICNLVMDYRISRTNYFPVPKDKSYIVVGHSLPECSVNDTIVKSAYNVAGSMEGYFYTYYKVKAILNNNPHVKGVFIEFTNNQVEEFAVNRISGEYLPFLLPKYSPVIDWEGLGYLFKKSPLAVYRALHASLKKKLVFIASSDVNYIRQGEWGGFHSTSGSLKASVIDSLRLLDLKQVKSKTVCNENIDYLKKTIAFCKKRGVKVFLLRSPLPSYMPVHMEEEFDSIMRNDFKDVPFFDYKDFPLTAEDFLDNQHLNHVGASKFSHALNKEIESAGFNSQW
jgi:hypothetical protein